MEQYLTKPATKSPASKVFKWALVIIIAIVALFFLFGFTSEPEHESVWVTGRAYTKDYSHYIGEGNERTHITMLRVREVQNAETRYYDVTVPTVHLHHISDAHTRRGFYRFDVTAVPDSLMEWKLDYAELN